MNNYFHQNPEPISTVQLSPFSEDEWNRIVTYAPIYVHWTDMLMMSQKRPYNNNNNKKLNLIDHIDLNALKLEDEILLNEIYHIRRTTTTPKGKTLDQSVNEEQFLPQVETINDEYQTSSGFLSDGKEPRKHYSSYSEPSFTQQQYETKQPVLTSQTNHPQINNINQLKRLPYLSSVIKPMTALSIQLRQSAIAREHVLSSRHERRSPTSLSICSSRRTVSTAHSTYRHLSRQQWTRTPLANDINPNSTTQESLAGDSSSTSVRRTGARNVNSSVTTMHRLKTKNDRLRQKQNIELKTILVTPRPQKPNIDRLLEETVPNSIEMMHKMCGPATAFERNLRYNLRKQLKQIRTGTINSK